MSTERAELPGAESEPGWRERLAEVADAASRVVSTRLAIFREELSVKAILVARGLAFAVAAAAMLVGTLLLAAALLAAIFAKLFGSVILGILATVVLYAAGTGAAAWAGIRALGRAKPFEFPATAEELSRDKAALAAALAPAEPPEAAGAGEAARAVPIDDLEERFRAGSE